MQTTAIQRDGTSVRFVSVRREGKHIVPVSMQKCTIDEFQVKPLYISKGILISGLGFDEILVSSISFSAIVNKKLKQALGLQAEAQLHLQPGDLLSTIRIDRTEKRATIFSTTRKTLACHLQEWAALKADPDHVGAAPAALGAFVRWKMPELNSYFLVNLEASQAHCLWVENQNVQRAHVVALDALHEGDVETEALRGIRREISRILHSFSCQRPIVFTGERESDWLRAFLLDALRDCVEEEKRLECSLEEKRYALCLGLAIDPIMHWRQSIQFRNSVAPSSRTLQKMGHFGAILLGSAFLASAGLYGIGSWQLKQREEEIIHNLETWAAAKDPQIRVELFSAGNDLKNLADQWLRLIEKDGKENRFLMRAPRVARVLDWLARHPLIESFRLAQDPFSIERIHYQLTSFPHLEAPRDPYLAKVEILFKTASHLHARKFHEALLQGEGPVDASREISWNVFADHYETSFYLKNDEAL